MWLSFLFFLPAWGVNLTGEARSLDGKEFLYTEKHRIELDSEGLNRKIETRYLRASGEEFARMKTDFSKDPLLPDILFEDLRFNRKEELLLINDGKTLLLKKTSSDGQVEEKKIPRRQDMVAGQGFDNFVKKNFESLQKKPRPLNFVVLANMDFFRFDGSHQGKVAEGLRRFGLRISSFMARLFVSEIQVDYSEQDKMLKAYRGLSNLTSDNGKQWLTFIEYKVENDKK